ncbi:Lysophospholipase L1 [Sinosporangium album]|uniref:Lysophospholipase L1 n=1 Tax=Sinosporangium album TaxID=504805 RepID=A0A1G7WNS7_9ACTN|nr:GDSL-type esterase/lipase family protein [Sinosporangium album]SDG73518.1 Lysophospholipase L1 [Sinosporangium album]
MIPEVQMRRLLPRFLPPVASAAALTLVTAFPAHAVARPAAEPLPGVMAALGDSISTGFNACGWYVSCTDRSWSAGHEASVRSHYRRLSALDGRLKGNNVNLAVPGATSRDLPGQAKEAVKAKADYVTILVGAQDACVRTEAQMTPVATYRARIDAALADLKAGLPNARVLIAGIPDLKRLWRVGKDSPVARTFWTLGRVCQAMLANPQSTAEADAERRDRVRARVKAFNAELGKACAAYGPACRTDGGAVFAYPFTLQHVSKWDYFHPNAEGQRVLAELTFKAGFEWGPLP